ncbi:MAG: Hsp20/alpha crystallin family protein [Paucibacter sp.]|nr:Hsp20/alpha crystallin family protein [Roseateles sp.]
MSSLARLDSFEQMLPEMLRRFKTSVRFGDEAPGEIRIDVTEKDKAYEVRAEVPGAKKEDIRVQVDGNFISISAEVHKDRQQKSGDRVVLTETYSGSASRGFSLPHEIDARGVLAKLEDGVLKLTLPKREGQSSQTIKVQ